MNNQKDYSTMKNETAIRRTAKKDAQSILFELLVDYFGEDAVKLVLKKDTLKDASEIAFCIGTAPDEDGNPCMDLCITIDPTVKTWTYKSKKGKNGEIFDYSPFDLIGENEAYEEAKKRVAKENAEKEAKRKEKIERDKEARRKAKEQEVKAK